MNKDLAKQILFTALFSAILITLVFILHGLPLLWKLIIVGAVITIMTKCMIDNLKDFVSPKELSMTEVKSFIKSKTFLLAAGMFLNSVSEGLFNVKLDDNSVEQIVSVDPANIGQAIASIGLIIIRSLDKQKKLV